MFRRKIEFPFQEPIRDELFSVERLEQYALFLARELRVSKSKRPGRSLLPQVKSNHAFLVKAYHELIECIESGDSVLPAGEWIIDNFHVIEDQVREIRQDLPEAFYRELPKLVEGELKGYPRVYALALSILAHTDSSLELDTLKRFVASFQSLSPLQIGEIWAVAIHLRIALVDNIRRIAAQATETARRRKEASLIVDRLLAESEITPKRLEDALGEIHSLLRSSGSCECSVLALITQRIRDQDPKFSPIMDNIGNYCAARNSSIENAIRDDHQKQAVAQASAKNTIQSMRLLSTLDWKDFFESVSLVDAALSRDPSRTYRKMDFESRNRYRDVIERISKRTRADEISIAESAVALSLQAAEDDPRKKHVGFYLVDEGARELKKLFHYRRTPLELLRTFMTDHPHAAYFLPLLALIGAGLAPVVAYTRMNGAPLWVSLLAAVAALTPISDTALNLLNLYISSILPPRVLPKLDFTRGIPDEAKTMVVVPVIFSDPASARRTLESLEIHYVANQDPNLFFALLSDFPDADTETTSSDASLLAALKEGIETLNRRYAEDHPRFFVFHRRRLWNESEGKWMGWERKRGKLHEFNRFLRGDGNTSFLMAPPPGTPFREIRYVITLDADTQLPRDAARKLVAAILHPLNAPRTDPRTRLVTKGYGILQPRVSISLESSVKTLFARVFSGHTGIDPYTTAVSDVYQDLFGEGIYTGKGLYEVDTFETALKGRARENSLLSHDLFEGEHARTALVSDIEFLDDYPSRYEAFAKRQHRWTRGDWQIAGWLFPKVHGEAGMTENPLPFRSRWKILDNLRRSLVAPFTFAWLVLAWTVLPGSPLLWTLATFALLMIPPYAHATSGIVLHPRGIPWTSNFWNVWGNFWTNTAQVLFVVCFLSHQAYLQCDAILRTLHRMLRSHKRMLEWTTAAATESTYAAGRLSAPFLLSSIAPAALAFVLVLAVARENLAVAGPILVSWFFFPVFATLISRERAPKGERLSREERFESLLLARKTWGFFETFVNERTNWLPPDNVQLEPKHVVAERSSPTNIGLFLLSTVAANELQFISKFDCLGRIERTLKTIDALEKFHGHLLNWYDTATLNPLEPRYISTVDSGNLAGHLIAVKETLRNFPDEPLFTEMRHQGILSGIQLLRKSAGKLPFERLDSSTSRRESFERSLRHCEKILQAPAPSALSGWRILLDGLNEALTKMAQQCVHWRNWEEIPAASETRQFLDANIRVVREFRGELGLIAPWLRLPQTEKKTDSLRRILARLDAVMSPAVEKETVEACINLLRKEPESSRADKESSALADSLARSHEALTDFIGRCHAAADHCQKIITGMDFGCLFDQTRKIFTIGLHTHTGQRDDSYYDLLASEARLASFVAIGLGQIPQMHWFHLGRQLTARYGKRILISWSASMFEYLMPLLVMRQFPNTLLYETHRAAVAIQEAYGRKRGVPWGVSESGYNARDLQENYQYAPFGVPGLGLKRGLRDDLVVAPYATALAALVAPRRALRNFRNMEKRGWLGTFGFFEAVDYTKSRVPQGQDFALVRSYMAHHQGMSLCALTNTLRDNILQRRFHSDAVVGSAEILLQERMPQKVEIRFPRREELSSEETLSKKWEEAVRRTDSPYPPHPKTHVLSNGEYTVMLNSAGSGFSRCGELAVTRWREDATSDRCGTHIYLKNRRRGGLWSATHTPVGKSADSYEVIFSEHKAEFSRIDGHIHSHLEIVVSPEDNVELRQLRISNRSHGAQDFEVTSYLEPVLLSPEADLSHPAFGKLFFQTELIEQKNALLGHRRRRSSSDKEQWMFHLLAKDPLIGKYEYETDRLQFIGRNRSIANPSAFERALSGTVGNVLDPAFSLRGSLTLPPEGSAKLCFVTGIAASRDEALQLIDRYHEASRFDREIEMAWTRSQAEAHHLNIGAPDVNLYQELASVLFYSSRTLRPRPELLRHSKLDQTHLWAHGISGDLPILAMRASASHDVPIARQLLSAHEYLRTKNIPFDLVILNDQETTYRSALQEEILFLIRAHGSQNLLNRRGGIFPLRTDLISPESKLLIEFAARAVIAPERGTLKEQVQRLARRESYGVQATGFPIREKPRWITPPSAKRLEYDNGTGGFTADGREYVIRVEPGKPTPAPWSNVVANKKAFGFLVTESGGGYTWSVNSRENKLTPWSNDPVIDPPGEALYLRDEETGEFWSPIPLSSRNAPYLARHGQGYSAFEYNGSGFSHVTTVFCPMEEELKIYSLRLKNRSGKSRRISAYFYVEWVLGVHRGKTAHYLRTETLPTPGILLARNTYDPEFGARFAFAAAPGHYFSHTCDRREFIGRGADVSYPAAMKMKHLGKRSGLGLDPCAALQCILELKDGEEKEILFLLGQSDSAEAIEDTVKKYANPEEAGRELKNVENFWNLALGGLEISTPDPDINFLFNRWLLYQTLSSRIWGRTGFYQAGGAYGFRDQLQDILALAHSQPAVARAHIIEAARHQFPEGDVLHWWHPPTGRGVRTHISDDLLWFPYAVCGYIKSTGDMSILDERAPFIQGPALSPESEDNYFKPETSGESATIYEHCRRSLERADSLGANGLPLMGGGDWNDGMNRVGHEGRGESVWLAWFLARVLTDFAEICGQRGDTASALLLRTRAGKLADAAETHAWDGAWYRRAYFDDGTPLGSRQNQECQIDSLAQSWAVLSGFGDSERVKSAMQAVWDRLVVKEKGIVMLLTPPFAESAKDPGYIKGYIPGVRENGGQYTHAAIWAMMAFAEIGERRKACEVFHMLIPSRHTATAELVQEYKVEPYVVAADIYASRPHAGRGGWTWYTGSSGWLYRAGIENILGIRRSGNKLRFSPCAPESWSRYRAKLRFGGSVYSIEFVNSPALQGKALLVEIDGKPADGGAVTLIDDASEHTVVVSASLTGN